MMIGMDGKGAGLFTQFQTIMEAADLYRREPTDTMVMHSEQESEKQKSKAGEEELTAARLRHTMVLQS
jgi:hypothetical protein